MVSCPHDHDPPSDASIVHSHCPVPPQGSIMSCHLDRENYRSQISHPHFQSRSTLKLQACAGLRGAAGLPCSRSSLLYLPHKSCHLQALPSKHSTSAADDSPDAGAGTNVSAPAPPLSLLLMPHCCSSGAAGLTDDSTCC